VRSPAPVRDFVPRRTTSFSPWRGLFSIVGTTRHRDLGWSLVACHRAGDRKGHSHFDEIGAHGRLTQEDCGKHMRRRIVGRDEGHKTRLIGVTQFCKTARNAATPGFLGEQWHRNVRASSRTLYISAGMPNDRDMKSPVAYHGTLHACCFAVTLMGCGVGRVIPPSPNPLGAAPCGRTVRRARRISTGRPLCGSGRGSSPTRSCFCPSRNYAARLNKCRSPHSP